MLGKLRTRVSLASLLVTVLLTQGGCFSYNAGRPHTVAAIEPIPASAWPARDIEAVKPFYEATPEQIFRYELEPGIALSDVNPEYAPFVQDRPDYTVHYCRLNGTGLLRCYTDHATSADFEAWDRVIYGFSPNASFLTSQRVNTKQFQEHLARASNPTSDDTLLKSLAPGLRLSKTHDRIALDQGIAMRLPRELPDDSHQLLGTLIHFTAMAGTEYEDAVMDALRSRGWTVLSISSEAWIRPPQRLEYAERLAELEARQKELLNEVGSLTMARFKTKDPQEKAELKLQEQELFQTLTSISREMGRLGRGAFQVCDESQVETVAQEIAAAVDNQLAEHAYAAEAALEYAWSQFPQLRDKPVVIIGFSAGSLAAPAAAARLRDVVDAVILIGAGAHAVEIARKGELTDGGVRVRCEDGEVPAYLMDQLSEAYLAHSRLDPYHTAAQLRNKRVLLVTAMHDSWVPRATAQLLRQQLGDPDRLTHLGGHRTLFYFLPSQARRIADWLERAVEDQRPH